MLRLTYKQNRQVKKCIKLRIKQNVSPRHGTKFAILKKRFRLHWNESVGANGASSCSSRYNNNSINMHSQTEFRTHHKFPKKKKKSIKNKGAKVSK